MLQGKKTYLVAIAAVLYAVFGVLSGNMDFATAMQIITPALAAAGLRSAIGSSKQ